MSYNADQIDYMESLARIDPAKKCWCCWYVLGECPHCPHGKTGADKIAARCPAERCHSAPAPDGSHGITHTIGCGTRKP